jgi:ribosomal protein S18 acetylase RimI-like enzyme
MNNRIRPLKSGDLDALYDICLKTGNAGEDATGLYSDPRLVGHVFAAPYSVLLPEWGFVVENASDVVGYVVGAPDTDAFAEMLEARWWPKLRRLYPDPGPPPHKTDDAARSHEIHHPPRPHEDVVASFPGHMHMNLLPQARGRGLGRQLFTAWCDRAAKKGVAGVHVGVSPVNTGGAAFWQACGMTPLPVEGVWFGLKLQGA